MPDPQAPRRFRNLSLTQWSAVAGILSSFAAVVAVFQPFFGGDNSKDPIGPTEELLQRVPAELRSSCGSSDSARVKGASAALECRLRGADGVVYVSFSRLGNLLKQLNDTPVSLRNGVCPHPWNAQWTYGLLDRPERQRLGTLQCYSAGGRSWIRWSRDDLQILAYVWRDDGKRQELFDAWNHAGPEDPND